MPIHWAGPQEKCIHADLADQGVTCRPLTKLALPRLRDGGRIINISSIEATLANPELIAYSAAMGALDAFTPSLAEELASDI